MIDSYPQELLSGLNELRQHEHFCDVTLKVESHCLPAHKVILASSSAYFKAMLTLVLWLFCFLSWLASFCLCSSKHCIYTKVLWIWKISV